MEHSLRKYFLISVCLHIALVLLLWVGMPTPNHKFTPPKKMIDVALISEKDLQGLGKKSKTILKNAKQKPKKKVTTQKKAPPAKKKVEVKKKAPPAPKKAPEVKKAEPKPVKKEIPKLNPLKDLTDAPEALKVKKKPEPEKKKTKEVVKKPQEKTSPVQKPEKLEEKQPPQEVAKEPEKQEVKVTKTPTPKVEKKPSLNALLKNVENLENQAITDNKNKRRIAGITDEDRAKIKKAQVTRLADKKSRTGQANGLLDPDEMDELREQIAQCWNVPVGARGIEDMIAEIAITVNHDKTVASAKLIGGWGRDNFYRSFAESALRAVQNPECSPLRLPDGKFDLWRNITFVFNAKDMLGY